MTGLSRYVLPASSVALFALVNTIAVMASGTGEARPTLVFCGIFAVAAAVQSVAWDREALGAALLLSLPPVVSLLAVQPLGSWLIGPLGALLLVASELNVVSGEVRVQEEVRPLVRRRIVDIGRLGAAGVAAAVAVGAVGRGPSLGGTAALLVAAAALSSLAWVIFGRGAASEESGGA